MADEAGPVENWRNFILPVTLAVGGALVIAFVFVPLISPSGDVDTVSAFLGALMFLLVAMAAGYAVKSRD